MQVERLKRVLLLDNRGGVHARNEIFRPRDRALKEYLRGM